MSENARVCVKCAWHRPKLLMSGIVIIHKCGHPRVVHRITGHEKLCFFARQTSAPCGLFGDCFTEKEVKP